MMQAEDSEGKFSQFRSRAEETLPLKPGDLEDSSSLSPEEVQQLVYELRVHQIQLEIQTEKLCVCRGGGVHHP
jgi:hypothetical protein